jgi:hypothetical protein
MDVHVQRNVLGLIPCEAATLLADRCATPVDRIPRQWVERAVAVQEQRSAAGKPPAVQANSVSRKELRRAWSPEGGNQAIEGGSVRPPWNVDGYVIEVTAREEERDEQCRYPIVGTDINPTRSFDGKATSVGIAQDWIPRKPLLQRAFVQVSESSSKLEGDGLSLLGRYSSRLAGAFGAWPCLPRPLAGLACHRELTPFLRFCVSMRATTSAEWSA